LVSVVKAVTSGPSFGNQVNLDVTAVTAAMAADVTVAIAAAEGVITAVAAMAAMDVITTAVAVTAKVPRRLVVGRLRWLRLLVPFVGEIGTLVTLAWHAVIAALRGVLIGCHSHVFYSGAFRNFSRADSLGLQTLF
jgi:hypothetical protein